MKNAFYLANIISIGGIESFFYYLSKKYKDWDITIYYKNADYNQLKRLKKLVRCKKYNDKEKIVCDKIFFNFNYEIIDNVDAKEYNLILHGDYKTMIKNHEIDVPPMHPKINNYYGVSQVVCDSFYELTGIKPILVYNPVVPDEPKKILKLVSFTRLSPEKGLSRIKKLANRLEERGILYQWDIFTNRPSKINNHVIFREPTLDAMSFLQGSSFLVQVSNDEGFRLYTS